MSISLPLTELYSRTGKEEKVFRTMNNSAGGMGAGPSKCNYLLREVVTNEPRAQREAQTRWMYVSREQGGKPFQIRIPGHRQAHAFGRS